MKKFIASEDLTILQHHGLTSFADLWDLELRAVDEPNIEKDGYSSVFRLELDGVGFYLKRQSNYFTRTLRHPFGEPTVAREFRNIMRYQRLGIPSLQATFFEERKTRGEHQALLITRALDDWTSLHDLLDGWSARSLQEQHALIDACAALVGQLHAAGLRHGCLYPKHLYLRLENGAWKGCLIDLEKTRRLWFSWRNQVRDLEQFLRTVQRWDDQEELRFLQGYLHACGASGSVELWKDRLMKRRLAKGKRGDNPHSRR